MPEEKHPQSPTKTKQERIRDNQRRSRARRQEYLADLERRLAECQITCREADIRKAALLELQIENTRLRELLGLAGVNDEFITNYVSQAVSQATHAQQETNSTHRQIKPKFSALENNAMLVNNVPTGRAIHSMSLGSSSVSTPAVTYASNGIISPSHSSASYSASSIAQRDALLDATNNNDMNWMYGNQAARPLQDANELFHCETFDIFARGVTRVADESTVLCSVAKQMIDQYHCTPNELNLIKTKLTPGICRPAYPGASCGVDNQTLFSILSELSAQHT